MTEDRLTELATKSILEAATPKVKVIKRDYSYNGYISGLVIKRSGAIRTVIEDDCGRLFIHNASELEEIDG